MSRGMGRIEAGVLRVLLERTADGYSGLDALSIAARVFDCVPDEKGNRYVTSAQVASTKRALASLVRKGAPIGRAGRMTSRRVDWIHCPDPTSYDWDKMRERALGRPWQPVVIVGGKTDGRTNPDP